MKHLYDCVLSFEILQDSYYIYSSGKNCVFPASLTIIIMI